MTATTDSKASDIGDLDDRPHVVMIVANDVTADTRVRKMAHDLASSGPQVTVLGIARTDHREVASLGAARIVRLPVARSLRDRPDPRPWSSRTPHNLSSRVRYLQDSFFVYQREVGARIGWIQREYFNSRQRRFDAANQRAAEKLRSADQRMSKIDRWQEFASQNLPWPGAKLGGKVGALAKRVVRKWLSTSQQRRKKRLMAREEKLYQGMLNKQEQLRRQLAKRHEELQVKIRRLNNLQSRSYAWRIRRPSWRADLHELGDYDAAFGPELDRLDPDVIHVHDVHLLGVAARAKGRAIIRGREPKLIYDAHEYIKGLARKTDREIKAWASLESEYIGHVDDVITVSEPLAELLKTDHQLPRHPTVVKNIPVVQSGPKRVRDEAGVPEDAPLVVYSGGADAARGVHTLVRAVGALDGVYLAIIAKTETEYIRHLKHIAEEGDYSDRLRIVPFVQPQHVVSYLRSATVGVHPLVAGPINHEVALPNKLFEYLHARLPITVSNCAAMAEFVTTNGIGTVFESGDADSLQAALAELLANLDEYRQVYRDNPQLFDTYSWEQQREAMFTVYRRLLPHFAIEYKPPTSVMPASSAGSRQATRVGIGPMNMAGQAWLWAKAIENAYPTVDTEVVEIVRGNRLVFPSDHRVDAAAWKSLDWQLEWAQFVANTFSHIIAESGVGFLGRMNGGTIGDDYPFLAAQGIEVAAVLHGSEVRDPKIHAELVACSPFRTSPEIARRLSRHVAETLATLDRFGGPVFISTLDLLDYLPDATWLPQVVDTNRWDNNIPFASNDKIKVLYTPTNRVLKGADQVEAAARELEDDGLIDFTSETRVPPEDMPALVAVHDVIIDGVVLGLYGTTSVEAMASGRLVLANIARVLDRLPEKPPIIHVDPDSLAATLRSIAESPDDYRHLANVGPRYVQRYHDGRYAAKQLAPFLGFLKDTPTLP